MKAMISIHDVTPATLSEVQRDVRRIQALALPPPTLLIVTGCDWRKHHLAVLRRLSAQGHALAAHGCTHKAREIRGIRHGIHALLLSRECAEHLSLSPKEIENLLIRSHAWFRDNGLPVPSFYVPPAWAMGGVNRDRLRGMPFRWYETLSGIYDSQTDIFYRMPLVGFQADNFFRKLFLRMFNPPSTCIGRWTDCAIRIAIHPGDFKLSLRPQLEKLLASPLEPLALEDMGKRRVD